MRSENKVHNLYTEGSKYISIRMPREAFPRTAPRHNICSHIGRVDNSLPEWGRCRVRSADRNSRVTRAHCDVSNTYDC